MLEKSEAKVLLKYVLNALTSKKMNPGATGDFATFQRRGNLLGVMDDPSRLIEMLEQEQQVKNASKSTIGFN